MNDAASAFLGLIITAIAMYGFYWVIRYAVRGGIEDAERRRERRRPEAAPPTAMIGMTEDATTALPAGVPGPRQAPARNADRR